MKHSYLLLQDMYGTEEMRRIWAERNMVQKWLDVEAAIASAQKELGLIPPDIADQIIGKCSVDYVTPQLIADVKGDVRHIMVAVMRTFAQVCGPAGEYLHLGATTQDILDTGLTLQIREAYSLLMDELSAIEEILLHRAEEHKATVMIGRTHGQHATPLTFGFKVAIWTSEIRDHIERLKQCANRLFFANISAAVGSNASFVYLLGKENTHRFHALVARKLDLRKPLIDLHQRTDRFVELLHIIALVGATLGRVGREINELQRPEIGEVAEPWLADGYYSSSTMPNKRNPEISEWQVALGKLARANAQAISSVEMQHERDATWMALELACIPESFLNCSAAIRMAKSVFQGLVVHAEQMRKNLYVQQGLAMSEVIMLRLYQKTGQKLTAHQLCYEASMKAFEEQRPLKELLLEHPKIRDLLTEEEIAEAINPLTYYGDCADQVEALVSHISALRKLEAESGSAWV